MDVDGGGSEGTSAALAMALREDPIENLSATDYLTHSGARPTRQSPRTALTVMKGVTKTGLLLAVRLGNLSFGFDRAVVGSVVPLKYPSHPGPDELDSRRKTPSLVHDPTPVTSIPSTAYVSLLYGSVSIFPPLQNSPIRRRSRKGC